MTQRPPRAQNCFNQSCHFRALPDGKLWNAALQVSTLGQTLVTHGSSSQTLPRKLFCVSQKTHISARGLDSELIHSPGVGFEESSFGEKKSASYKIRQVPETRTMQQG